MSEREPLLRIEVLSASRLWIIGTVVATVVGGTYGLQRLVLRLARDQQPDVFATVGTQAVPWYAWALLLPAIARVCARYPVSVDRPQRWLMQYLAAGVVASVVHTALCVVPIGLISDWTTVNLPLWVGFQQLLLNRGVSAFVEFALIAAVLQAVTFHQQSLAHAQATRALERLVTETELRALRMQLEPHFLFNTLNAIGAYVRAEPAMAESMIRHLSTVLRAVLDGDRKATSTVSEEMELVRCYLAIHEARMGARLAVRIAMSPDAERASIPTLLLQPLVENAIVHGAARRPGNVAIEVSADRDGDRVRLLVVDRGARHTDATAQTTSSGIGLANTRARLEHLYGADHRLYVNMDDDATRVAIEIPYTMTEQAA
jgi:anti-sigma regulatory factor (Ser/Thr protein kinase)